jgi:hypothetical protein
MALYTIDFVRYILERHHFPIMNVFLALEKAKFAQIYTLDLSLWFTMDNEVSHFLFFILRKYPFRLFFSLHLHRSNSF